MITKHSSITVSPLATDVGAGRSTTVTATVHDAEGKRGDETDAQFHARGSVPLFRGRQHNDRRADETEAQYRSRHGLGDEHPARQPGETDAQYDARVGSDPRFLGRNRDDVSGRRANETDAEYEARAGGERDGRNNDQFPATRQPGETDAQYAARYGDRIAADPRYLDGYVTFTSSDPAVATVDEAGVVTGRKAGKVTITAHSGGHRAISVITVA